MSDIIDRFVMLAAASNLTRREIVELHNGLRRLSPEDLIWRVNDLRNTMLRSNEHRMIERRPTKLESNWAIGDRVAKLLKEEAGLSSSAAYRIFATALIQDGLTNSIEIPTLSKKSFNDWVDRVAQVIPPKDLLRVATKIRNNVAGDDQADWITTTKE